MPKFNPGDKVRRIDWGYPSLGMTIGSVHTVKSCDDDWAVYLDGEERPWNFTYFELVEPAASAPVVYEVGKTYSFLDFAGNNLRICIGFTSKGLPVFEREDGTVFSKNGGIEFKEVVKPKSGKVWVNVYLDPDDNTPYAYGYHTEDEAKKEKHFDDDRIACVEVNWTKGEGL